MPKLKPAAILLALAPLLVPGLALADPSAEQMQQIDAVLTPLSCEVDPDNVDVLESGFDLDDVICADGQYDVVLDAEYKVTEKRKE